MHQSGAGHGAVGRGMLRLGRGRSRLTQKSVNDVLRRAPTAADSQLGLTTRPANKMAFVG